MRPRSLLALVAIAACGACDIDVRSVRVGTAVPTLLLGEWSGSWQSARESQGGRVVVRVANFAGQAVVSVDIDNPCLQPRVYELVASGTRFELRADGAPVFAATLGEQRTLDGTYQCPEDDGTWSVRWQRDLPALPDFSGSWSGAVATTAGTTALQAQLQQQVVDGMLQLVGTLSLPELLPGSLPVRGVVNHRAGAFDWLMATEPGVLPALQLAGVGDPAARRVDDGVLLAATDPRLPFRTAIWRLAWQTP